MKKIVFGVVAAANAALIDARCFTYPELQQTGGRARIETGRYYDAVRITPRRDRYLVESAAGASLGRVVVGEEAHGFVSPQSFYWLGDADDEEEAPLIATATLEVLVEGAVEEKGLVEPDGGRRIEEWTRHTLKFDVSDCLGHPIALGYITLHFSPDIEDVPVQVKTILFDRTTDSINRVSSPIGHGHLDMAGSSRMHISFRSSWSMVPRTSIVISKPHGTPYWEVGKQNISREQLMREADDEALARLPNSGSYVAFPVRATLFDIRAMALYGILQSYYSALMK